MFRHRFATFGNIPEMCKIGVFQRNISKSIKYLFVFKYISEN